MELRTVREALATKLRLITTSQLTVSPYLLASPALPMIWVMGPEEVNYHHASANESRMMILVQGIAPAGLADVTAQQMVDEWLSDTGANSVRAVLETDPTLGGVTEDVTVHKASGYEVFVVPELGARLGTIWDVELLF